MSTAVKTLTRVSPSVISTMLTYLEDPYKDLIEEGRFNIQWSYNPTADRLTKLNSINAERLWAWCKKIAPHADMGTCYFGLQTGVIEPLPYSLPTARGAILASPENTSLMWVTGNGINHAVTPGTIVEYDTRKSHNILSDEDFWFISVITCASKYKPKGGTT